MATNTSTPELSPEPAGRPTWTTPLFTILGLVILAVVASQLLGRGNDKDIASFSAANATIGSILPVFVAAVVAWLVPQGHTWRVRLPLALIAGLFAVFIVAMWPSIPGVATATDTASPPGESRTLLSWLIGLPLAGAIAILFLPRQAPRVLRATTMAVMLGTLLAAIPLLRVEMGRTFHFNQDVMWIARFGIHYHVAIDGISLWLVILTVFITPIAAYASFGSIGTRIKDWCFALLLLEAGMIGAFVALDLFLFYVFWELMLIPMYVMIGVWGGTNRIKAALKFFLYTMAGSLLMLAAILYVAYTYGRVTGGSASFDFFELQRLQIPRHVQGYLWFGFAISFFIKVPMWPVHTWLPDAHTEAPTAGSVILAAVMLKMGTYGYLRFCMGLFPEISGELAATLGGVAVLGGILYGALCAWRQDDVKRLVAYSSVAHLGYVMLGLFAGTAGSIEGAVLQMVNHGVTTGALFLLVGVIYDRRHTRILDDFGGLARVMPIYATLFIIATMASVGVPGLNGFTGEFLIITGTFASDKLGHVSGIQSVGAALGVILAALYMLTAVQKMFFGPITRDENKRLLDINPREMIAVAPLIIAMFVLGLAPNLLLNQMHGAVERVLADYEYRAKLPGGGTKYYDGPIRLGPRRPDTPAAIGNVPPPTTGGIAVPGDEPPPSAAPPGRPGMPGGMPGMPGGLPGGAPLRAASVIPTAASFRARAATPPRSLRTQTMALAFILSPLLVIGIGALMLMLAEAFGPKHNKAAGLALGTTIVFGAGLAFSVGAWLYGVEDVAEREMLAPWLVIDRFSIFFDGLLCLGGALAALLAGGYLREHEMERGEFYALLLFATMGAMMVASAGDALMVFLGLETMSIGAYALTAFRRTSPRSAEGALKYFLLGSFAAAILLYGFALLYGATGHTDLAGIGEAVRSGGEHQRMILVALALVLAGLLFKVSAVPFHMWTPDAYEGAPTPATTYMGAVVKAGGFAMLLRVMLTCFGDKGSMSWSAGWPPVVAWIAVLTMTVANLVAGQQESVKRMLAYSSIAHAGYLLVGVVSSIHSPAQGSASVLFYLLTYTVSTVGAFGALILCGRRGAEAVSYEDLAGIGRRHPAAALAFSLFLLSLAGIPPTAGFFGKWFVFRSAMDAGLYTLTVVAFLNSVIGVYYYLRVLVFMYMREPAAGAPIATPMRSGYVNAALVVSAILVVALGVAPSLSLDVAVKATEKTFVAPGG